MSAGPTTLDRALALRAEQPDRGFRFLTTDGKDHFWSYPAMAAEAHRRAAHFAKLGLKKGDRIAFVIAETDAFVLSFFGACVGGFVPVPIFPRATFKALDGYLDTVAHICEASHARVLLTMEGTKQYVEGVLGRGVGVEHVLTTETAFEGETPAFTPPVVEPSDLCFLQFTSGSTSRPKGVMVSHQNLVANATAFLGPAGLDRNDADVGLSWLPLYHDMGLIGFVLGTLICDIQAVLLPTSSFARGPRMWLEALQKYRGTITYAPNFAYALAAKRVKARDLADLDLSHVRVAGCGAEPIQAQTLRDFAEKLAPTGFKATAFLPSYGMAEATLAITFHQLGTPMVTDLVDAAEMKLGRATKAPDGARPGPGVVENVSCGVGFPGHEVQIVDDEAKPVGERVVGQIVTRGPSVTAGYYENPSATAESWRDGWLQTGDLGYVADGNLYVCGRLKDLIIIHGANYYPPDLEWAVQSVEGVRRGNCVAFSVTRDGEERLVVCAEGNSGDVELLQKQIAEKVYEASGLTCYAIEICPTGSLPKTSSGKAQRRKTKQMYEDGTLEKHGA